MHVQAKTEMLYMHDRYALYAVLAMGGNRTGKTFPCWQESIVSAVSEPRLQIMTYLFPTAPITTLLTLRARGERMSRAVIGNLVCHLPFASMGNKMTGRTLRRTMVTQMHSCSRQRLLTLTEIVCDWSIEKWVARV